MLVSVIRLIFVLGGVIVASVAVQLLSYSFFPAEGYGGFLFVFAFILVGAGAGYAIGGMLGRKLTKAVRWLEDWLQKVSASDLVFGSLGLVGGMLLAYLLFPLLREIGGVGIFLSILSFFILGSLGFELFLSKKEELKRIIQPQRLTQQQAEQVLQPSEKILDTSVIIDARIADIWGTGFIEGRLNVPHFVLKELREIADSKDSLKRSRGRRGLEILSHLQKEPQTEVKILEKDFPQLSEVDEKLVRLAKEIKGTLLTTDYNLHKVAEVQGVKVLNINELANTLKPMSLPGEELKILLIKEGKEAEQGVGYLDDGTMVVVEEGKKCLGEEVEVVVTSTLQTPVGRMIFSKLK